MIKVNNLTFKYDRKEKPTVDGISFEVGKGEVFGFLGPNGAGKSTTQKILTRLLAGYSGDVRVLDRDLKDWGKDYFKKIGVGFEMPTNYQKLTALENISFFQSLYDGDTEDPEKLLKIVGLQKDSHTKVGNFSKGMQMRLNFARALLNKPDIIFLDEPTSGLDPASARNIKDIILERKRKGCTIFLTTHNMFVADELCDRVAFIVDGKIALIDSPQKLKIEQGERVVAVRYTRDGKLVEKEFPLEGLAENGSFINTIKNEKVETIHTREPSLEDIFIRITGRDLQ